MSKCKMKIIIGVLIIGLLILAGCESGQDRAAYFEASCTTRGMIYTNPFFVPQSAYDCVDAKGEVHTFIRESSAGDCS